MNVKAHLFERLDGGAVRCGTCQRQCLIPLGRTGWCGTRKNKEGLLYSLIYGDVSSISVNPIEKKPVFHFYPGSRWLSLGSLGCNFRCPGCQNWEISHWTHGERSTQYLSPDDAVTAAKTAGCIGLSWTFNEPTLWLEYTLDGAKAAKRRGLFTNYVTNGSISREALAEIAPVLDVFRVDIKGFSDATYRRIGHVERTAEILEVARQAKAFGMHVEVVTNVIPGVNDSDTELRGIAAWIRTALGAETPWHVTRFFPQRKLASLPPTPIAQLERARTIGTDAGLRYVYLGNVPGHEWANTYCHACGDLLIERYGLDVITNNVSGGRCTACGEPVHGVF